jgi:1-acyl-sn-glycerol-3-phosphate acyltransferase
MEEIMIGMILYACIIYPIRALMKIGWFRWRVEGLENLPPRDQGGMLFVTNHINWVDIPALGALMPFSYRLSWLGKVEIFEHPLARWFFNTMNVIPINRGKRDLSALKASEDTLKNGAILTIFPEGHRSRNGVLQKGHGGAVRMAMRSGVPIVPAAITGSEHGFIGGFKRKELVLRIGKPYTLEPTPNNKIPPDMMEELTNDMMVRIASLMPEEYHGHYAEQTRERLANVSRTSQTQSSDNSSL